MKWTRSHYTNYRNSQHLSYFIIEQRQLKGVSSFKKNLNVFKVKYYTSLFSPELGKKKGYMELNKLGRNVFIKQTPTICVTVLSEWSKAGIAGLSLTVISCFRYLQWHYIAGWWLGIVSGYKFYFEFTVNDNKHRFSILLLYPNHPLLWSVHFGGESWILP